MKQKVSIFMVIFIVLAFLAGCTSDNQAYDDLQERTFLLITKFMEYTNEEINVLLFEEIISSSPDTWDFMVLEPDKPIQDSNFIQVGAPIAFTDFQFSLEIGFGDMETGVRLYRLLTEDKNVILQYFIDYWQEQRIPDISLWEDISLWREYVSYEHLEFHAPENAVIAYLEGLRDKDSGIRI